MRREIMTTDQNDSRLLSTIRSCSQCPDLPLGPRPILQWHRDARILIAGQAPGRVTHEKGVPFNDPSGDRLRSWLGVAPETFYDPAMFAIVPMAFCYPGTGHSGDLPPPPVCARLWRSQLLERMQGLHLTIIIGQYAAAWHYPDRKGTLTGLVCRWKESFPDAVVLPHPSPRNRIWLSRNPWFEEDLLPRLRTRVAEILASLRPDAPSQP
jgi:uracil-DNA glycosylase